MIGDVVGDRDALTRMVKYNLDAGHVVDIDPIKLGREIGMDTCVRVKFQR